MISLSIFMILTLVVACSKKEDKNETVETNTEKQEKPVLGGWNINSEVTTVVITKDAQEAFEKAMAQYNGIEMEPVVLLAKQVVSGTNYSFLAKSKNANEPQWFITIVYNDLQGNAKISSAEAIDISDIKVTDKLPENLLGAWQLMPVSNAVTLPEEIWNKFFEANEAHVGINLNPLALLATQVVSGQNYLILCLGNASTQNPIEALYVATLYVDTQGKAQITNVDIFDVLAYEE